MKRTVPVVLLVMLCVASLSSCGNTQSASEAVTGQIMTESVEETETSSIEPTTEEDNKMLDYFRANGNADGDIYLIKTDLIEDMPAEWTISVSQPELILCHALWNDMTDCYFRYYINSRIISYTIESTDIINAKDVNFKTFGMVDEKAFQEGDTNTISRLLVDDKATDPSEYGGSEVFDNNVNVFIPAVCKQLREFGVEETGTSDNNERRSEEQLLRSLPADDECVNILKTTEVVIEPLIPEEYRKDAESLDLYDAVMNGETDYLLSFLGECDTIKNVKDNKFSFYVGRLLDEIGFYGATELQQNFLEMYVYFGCANSTAAKHDLFQSVYASGFYADGRGNADNIIDTSYIVGRCIAVQTGNNTWLVFTNQLVGSHNTYPSEKITQVEEPEIENNQFVLKYGDIPFTFTKVEDSFFDHDKALKAYQLGRIINEFNTECIGSWEEYYQEKEAAKYEPGIGMTKQEVLNSTWGSPKDKNITETQYGTSEQWVYGNGKYVYFDDGIVTAIQK